MTIFKRRFGIESNDQDKTLIDQQIESNQAGEATVMSLTNQVLAERKERVDEIKKAQEEAAKAEEEGFGDDGGDSSFDNDSDDSSSDDSDSGDDDLGFDMDDLGFDDPADDADEEEKDKDKDKGEEENKDDDKEDDVGTESVLANLKSSWGIFRGIKTLQQNHLSRMRSFGIGIEGASDVQIDQPVTDPIDDGTVNVVYAKEAMIEAIQKLGNTNKRYITNTQSFIEKMNTAIMSFEKRIGNFEIVIAGGQVSFTNKVISDVPLLKTVSYEETSDPKKTIKRIRDYLKATNDLTTVIASSDFDDIDSAVAASGFNAGTEFFVYKNQQPGFVTIEAKLANYISYLKTNITDYQFYSVTEDNTSALFNIPGITLTDEKDLATIINNMKDIITDTSLSVDILKAVSGNFSKYMDELKVLRVGIEDGEFEKLADLGFDNKIKDFIKMKLIVEIISVNVNLAFNYLTGLAGILDVAVKFNDVE